MIPLLRSRSCAHSIDLHAGPLAALLLTLFASAVSPALAQTPADTKFIASATEDAFGRVTFPAFRGSSSGLAVYYIITEASDLTTAQQLGVNYAPVLANARDSAAVQRVSTNTGPFTFPATVDFSPVRSATQLGSIGFPGYSPLIQLPNGVILNAPHVANGTGNHDRVTLLDTVALRVTLDEADGFQGNQPVRYLATDASDAGAAIAERATFAPALQSLPGAAAANLALIGNGQTGLNNVQRQGVNSVVESAQADPLNVLEFNPLQPEYSPLWEVEPHNWTAAEAAAGRNVRQRDYNAVEDLEDQGRIVTPPPAAIDVYVNCPIVAQRSTAVAPTFTPIISPSTTNFRGSGAVQRGRNNGLLTVTINNGSGGGPASGVLVALTTQYVLSPRAPVTCTTNSTGQCTISYIGVDAGPVVFEVTNLNRVGQSPGERAISISGQ